MKPPSWEDMPLTAKFCLDKRCIDNGCWDCFGNCNCGCKTDMKGKVRCVGKPAGYDQTKSL